MTSVWMSSSGTRNKPWIGMTLWTLSEATDATLIYEYENILVNKTPAWMKLCDPKSFGSASLVQNHRMVTTEPTCAPDNSARQ